MNRARAILWAQWRCMRRAAPGRGVTWSAVIAVLWYGMWLVAAVVVARIIASPESVELLPALLPGGLLLVLLYWQVVPLLLAATGASLDLRKLQAYPIPMRQLFGIEALLRVTGAIEMLLILLGAGVGVVLNPRLTRAAALAVVPYILLNLFVAVGLRDLLARLLARKRVREVLFFVLVLGAALPQVFVARGGRGTGPVRYLLARDAWPGWPWTATANLMQGRSIAFASAVLLAWCAAAAVFGLWQFSRTLSFDAQAARASGDRPAGRAGPLERLYRLPSVLFRDPLGALVEKEIRVLARSPRFRLVFLMGFTFGLVIWFPMAFGRVSDSQSFMRSNYLTVVSVYSLLLLSEVCFWNSFGFDRSAAQVYFLAPVEFSRVLISKNISAIVFVMLEILAVTAVCTLMGLRLGPAKMAESFTVAGVISIFLLGAGNLLSLRQPRGVNPENSFSTAGARRVQAVLLIVYPIAFLPVGLAYLARYALDTEWAFFGVLAFDAIVGIIVYRLALESAVARAERTKETIVAALSAGEGPIAG